MALMRFNWAILLTHRYVMFYVCILYCSTRLYYVTCSLMIVCLTPFICVANFSMFVLSCVCQLCNKEYIMMFTQTWSTHA